MQNGTRLWHLTLTPGGEERSGRKTCAPIEHEADGLGAGIYQAGWNWGGGTGPDVFICEIPADLTDEQAEELVMALALDAI